MTLGKSSLPGPQFPHMQIGEQSVDGIGEDTLHGLSHKGLNSSTF